MRVKWKKIVSYLLTLVIVMGSWSWNGLTVEAEESYYWPTPTVTTLSRSYNSSHGGIDIKTPVGTNIYATKSGTVIGIGTACSCIGKGPKSDKPCGHVLYYNGEHVGGIGSGIIIKHDDGSGYALYGHMTADSWPTDVYLGVHVNQGQFIGKTGNSGYSDGPHLHFELRDNASKYVFKCNKINTDKDKIDYVYDYLGTSEGGTDSTINTLLTHTTVTNITETSAHINANLSSYLDVTDSGFYLGTSPDNMEHYTKHESGSQVKSLSYNLGTTGSWTKALSAGTTYYYQIYAVIGGVTYKTSVDSFTTTGTSQSPTISNVKVSEIDKTGYTVTCEVSEDVIRVCFPTWTEANDQDDLSNNWYEDSIGEKADDSNIYSFRVNISDHNNEGGKYITHVYAFNAAGNKAIEAVAAIVELEETPAACEHSLAKTEAVAATCVMAGNIEYYTCTKCNKIYSDAEGTTEVTTTEVAATGKHAEEIRNAVAATEEATGYTGDTYCSVCDQKLAEGTIIEKLAHTHSMNHTEAVAATCAKAGNIEYYTCTKCNKTYLDAEGTVEVTTTEVAATGKHTEEIRNAIAATEEAAGYTGDTYCSVCDQKLAEGTVIEKLDHTHNMTHTEAVAATCTTAGNIEYYTCTKCNKIYADAEGTLEVTTIEVAATGKHTEEIRNAVAATEDATGYTGDTYCSVCDQKLAEGTVIEKLDHTHSMKHTEAVAATCAKPGNIEYYTCTKCNKIYADAEGIVEVTTTEVAATGKHTEEIRNAVAATEEATGYTGDTYCTVCEQKLANGTVIEKLDHTHSMTHTEAVAATCEKAGNIEYYTCTKCNKMYTDEVGTKEVTDISVKATEHVAAKEWKTDKNNHWKECTACSTKADEAAHLYDNGADAKCNACDYQRFYVITSGANSAYTKDSDTNITVTADGAFKLFKAVKVDDVVVDASNYSVVEGSTVVTFTKAYLNGLSSADHSLEIVFSDDKSAKTQFTIKDAVVDNTESNDNTGNNDNAGSSDNTGNNNAGTNDNTSSNNNAGGNDTTVNNNNTSTNNGTNNNVADNNNASANEAVKEPVVENTNTTTPSSPKTGEQNSMYIILICLLVFAGLGGALVVKKIK